MVNFDRKMGERVADKRLNVMLDADRAKCNPRYGWEPGQGKCVRVAEPKKNKANKGNNKNRNKSSGKTVAAAKSMLKAFNMATKQLVSTPLGRLGLFVAGEASIRGARLAMVEPAPTDQLNIFKSSDVESLEMGQTIGQGMTAEVSLVKDKKTGEDYVLKSFNPAPGMNQEQRFQAEFIYVYGSAIEATVSDIGQKAGIPTVSTSLLGGKDVAKLRGNNSGYAGVVQSVAKGIPVLQQKNDIRSGALTKRYKAFDSLNTARMMDMDSVPPEGRMSLRNINAMGSHPDMAKIMALDTFTGNPDRHDQNLFYDRETDSFTAIDNGLAYASQKIPRGISASVRRDASRIKNHIENNPQAKKGLQEYRDTLAELIEANPPKKTKATLLGYMNKDKASNFVSSFYRRSQKIANVDATYRANKKILRELDKLLT